MEEAEEDSKESQIVDIYKLYSLKEQKNFITAIESCADSVTIFQQILINYHTINFDKKIYLDGFENLKKFYIDSVYVKGLLKDISDGCQCDGTFGVLIKLIEEHNWRDEKKKIVLTNYIITQKLIENLSETIKHEMNIMSDRIKYLKDQLINLKKKRAKLLEEARKKIRYTNDWERTQCEQSCLKYNVVLRNFNHFKNTNLIKKKNEKLISYEINNFLEKNISLHQEYVENWKKLYIHDMKMYDTINTKLRNDIECKRDVLEILKTKFHFRQNFINDYLEEKKKEELLRELEKNKHKSAIKIQFWWRGVMAKQKLGPYRADEKKRKPKQAKK